MLQIGGNGMISGRQNTCNCDVQRHGGIRGEHHMIRLRAAQQPRQLLTGLEHRARGLHGCAMRPSCSVARRQNCLFHRFSDLRRLVQRGGRVIQIDQLFHQNISNTQHAPWAIPACSSAPHSSCCWPGSAFHAKPQPAVIWEGIGIIRPGREERVKRSSAASACDVLSKAMTSAGFF